eukprot:scaffold61328_cov68-Phaeocystis_antarctica.AAC.2
MLGALRSIPVSLKPHASSTNASSCACRARACAEGVLRVADLAEAEVGAAHRQSRAARPRACHGRDAGHAHERRLRVELSRHTPRRAPLAVNRTDPEGVGRAGLQTAHRELTAVWVAGVTGEQRVVDRTDRTTRQAAADCVGHDRLSAVWRRLPGKRDGGRRSEPCRRVRLLGQHGENTHQQQVESCLPHESALLADR